jgi:hypothetical protein
VQKNNDERNVVLVMKISLLASYNNRMVAEGKSTTENTEDRTGRRKCRDTCLLAFACGLTNDQHGMVGDTNKAARGGGSLAADASVLAIIFGDRPRSERELRFVRVDIFWRRWR